MGNNLESAVHVGGEIYLPGDQEIPAEALAKMGDHCFIDGIRPDAAAQPGADGEAKAEAEAEAEARAKAEAEAQSQGGGALIPPKAGPGSNRDAWATYANSVGVAIEDADNRDAIIAKVADAGQPVE